MTVFKTYLKVLNKNKGIIILYSVMLIIFGGFSIESNEANPTYEASKPKIVIINKDDDNVLTNNFVKYIKKNSQIVKIKDTKEKRLDALFYRDIHYIINIPSNYHNDFINGKNPEIVVQSLNSYSASLEELLIKRYLKVQDTYYKSIKDENKLVSKINDTLKEQTKVKVTSKLNTSSISKIAFYYNFASYSILAATVYVICLILSSFKEQKVLKRTIISSTGYKTINRRLLLSNILFAFALWLLYVICSFIIVGKDVLSIQGLICIINSLIFTCCATTLAFLIGNLVSNKNAINGIIQVVAIGSSFLCGVFVPMEYLPKVVINMGKVLPSYYYVITNNSLSNLEHINFTTLKPIFINMSILVLYSILFIVLANLVSKKKRKFG